MPDEYNDNYDNLSDEELRATDQPLTPEEAAGSFSLDPGADMEPTLDNINISPDEELTEERPVSPPTETNLDLPDPKTADDRHKATDTMTGDFDGIDDDIPFKLPEVAHLKGLPTVDGRFDQQRQATMPVFRDADLRDGEGNVYQQSEPTLQNQRPVAPQRVQQQQSNIPSPPPAARPQAQSPEYTMPNANLADSRYQRSQQSGGQGQYVPAPPQQQSKKLPRRRARRNRILGMPAGCVWVFLGLMLTFCGGTTLLTVGAGIVFIPRIEDQWTSEIERVDDYEAFQSSFIYDRYGNELFEVFGEGRRTTVPYERFPDFLINATIATEDNSFWENIGIDVPATTVALLNFIRPSNDGRPPGGSTITQQVVKNVLFDFEKRATVSAGRKAEEIILAMLLTQRKSKEEVLELYLNEIYYGNLAYGAQTAATTFFDKNVEDLTLGEAALLAGLPQAPATLDPLNPDPQVQANVFARQRLVLDLMLDEGYITQQQHDDALREGLSLSSPDVPLEAPHFTVYAQGELERLMLDLGYSLEELTNGGFKVYTTVDQDVNNLALRAAQQQIDAIRQGKGASNASVVVMKPLTGEILAMVGSIDYDSQVIDGRVNVAIALRQPGSTMKPFTYAAAMERGFTAGDVLWDTRTEIGIPGQANYVPVNYDRRYHGPMTIRTALANSFNIPAVQMLRLVGVDYYLQFLERFGVTSLGTDASRYGLSLTLGGGEISLVEMTNGYSTFANQGSYVPSTSILCVIDGDDNIIYQYEGGCLEGRQTDSTVNRTGFGRQTLDPRIAFVITDMLSDNNARALAIGTRTPLYTPNIQSAVKTGTTNDIRDNWTIGYTRNVAIGVWVGNNDNSPMINSSGLAGASPIWNAVMTGIYENSQLLNPFAVNGGFQPDKASPPTGVSQQQICDMRRMQDPALDCPRTSEWFLDGPSGIPDADGNLSYPPAQIVNNVQSSEYLRQTSPDVYRALVYPLPANVAAGIQFNLSPGDKQPLPPRYCRVTPQL
ncbi:MAG: transglycosylase domain-containing protein, partial [Aggregatilineales bacterium]